MDTQKAREIFITAINEYEGYDYLGDEDIDDLVETRDEMSDFFNNQIHLKTAQTSQGSLEVFLVKGDQILKVMDFGEFRLAFNE